MGKVRQAALCAARPRLRRVAQGPWQKISSFKRLTDYLLDPTDGNVTIATLQRAAEILGRKVRLDLVLAKTPLSPHDFIDDTILFKGGSFKAKADREARLMTRMKRQIAGGSSSAGAEF